MPRNLLFALAITALLFAACDKDNETEPEDVFHGTWVKGSNYGDTIWFYKKNGVHIMKSNQSFNPGLYAPYEREYKFENNQFALVYNNGTTPTGLEFPVASFKWTVPGKRFEVQGSDFYMFLASTLVKYEFRKIF
jgi:hypothetical protein